MTRTRLRQLEQLRSSENYNDGYDQSLAETDPNQILENDLNHIRSQLRLLNNPSSPTGTANWYDQPVAEPIDMFNTQIEVGTISAGIAIDVGGNYAAGAPYDLSVYLNGNLLLPSTIIAGPSVSDSNDYQEVDASGALVMTGQVGRKIKTNFDIIPGDILQFIWNK